MAITAIPLPEQGIRRGAGTDPQRILSRPTRIGVRGLVFLSLAFILVGNLFRLPVFSAGSTQAPILLNDFLVLAVVGVAVVLALQRRHLELDRVAQLAIGFITVGGVSSLLSLVRYDLAISELAYSLAYLGRWALYFGIYLTVINHLSSRDVTRGWKIFERMVLVFAVFGIFQSIFLPGFAQIVYPQAELFVDWDPQGHRLVSTFLDPNFAGALILFPLLFFIAELSSGRRPTVWKGLLLLTALVLTVSRSSFLAFLAGVAVIVIVRGVSRRLLKMAGVAVLLMVPFLPLVVDFAATYGKFTIGPSALARVGAWLQAFDAIQANPVIGVGFNTWGFVSHHFGGDVIGRAGFSLDGGLIFIAVMTGMVGLTLYGAMLTVVVARCRRIWRAGNRSDEHVTFAVAIAAITIAMVVHSLFLNSLLYAFLMHPLWFLWGMSRVLESASDNPAGHEGSAPLPMIAPLRQHG